MTKVLGLDLGTNSIGVAVIDSQTNKIELASSRIIPMDAEMMGNFDKGNTVSQTASRREFRSVRRLRQRHLLRRERLHRVLNILGFLPQHYAAQIDFENHYGQIKPEKEPKLAWHKIDATGEYEFIFKPSFQEMLADFRTNQPSVFLPKSDGSQALVPYDWTIYYLRKKALRQAITKQELAWLLLNFNQKRGYYQLRGEEEDEDVSDKRVEYCKLKVVSVEATDDKKGNDIWYNVHLENGWIYRRTSSEPLDWTGKIKEFIVTTTLEKDGTPKLDKQGQVKRSFRAPKDTDWTLVKKRTESELEDSGKTVGQFIYDTLLQVPNQKIKGKLVSVIERKYYKDELIKILDKQKEFHPELTCKTMLEKLLLELYKNNENHRRNLESKDVCNLLLNDIIFYQRPLKSKKSLIAKCKYEENYYMKDGQLKTMPLKVMPCSNPFYQEFRLWKFVSDLRIYCYDELLCQESDVTNEQIKDKAKLYKLLNDKAAIDQKGCLKLLEIKDTKLKKYTWNYDDTRARPCNETRGLIMEALRKKKVQCDFMNDPAAEYALWHILYSVTDKMELEGALGKFAARYKIDGKELFVSALKRIKPFSSDYGSYSEKACKKILPLMRAGEFWSQDNISPMVRERIDKIINGEFDERIDDRTREKCAALTNIQDFSGLPEWLASYVAYGRHAEAKDIDKWTKPEDIDLYLRHFKQHSMRNPIVEQIVTETLRTVRDVWKQVGQIDEIHVELGREMKKTASQRKELSEYVAKNEDTNIRIKMLLQEFVNPEYNISGVRPYSPSQQSILRIYEQEALNCSGEIPEYVDQILKKFKELDVKKQPSKSEVMRYKLWLEQKCCSPYTGKVISLAELFTSAYEIEHVIPKARFFDDSLSNKVVCESEVNKLKDNDLARSFIEKSQGKKVTLSGGDVVNILSADSYDQFVKARYKNNKTKLKKLLMTEIPDDFNKRQLNDTRYISKFITGLLSNIVREEGEIDAISKNVIPCSGGITDRLKQEWGLNDVWNDIVYPRFERLNSLTQSCNFGEWTNKEGKRVFQTQMPVELSKGFSKKRIDHRHHALDAITIACATRSHVNYLNNVNARTDNRTGKTVSGSNSLNGLRYDLQHKLCYKFKLDDRGKYQWRFHKPWDTFTQDTRQAIQGIIVGFKQNLRVINKATNSTLHYNEEGKKELKTQDGLNWAIRKSMHKDTVFGRVNLRFTKFVRVSEVLGKYKVIVDQAIKRDVERMMMEGLDSKEIIKKLKEQDISKVEIYYFSDETSAKFGATRKPLDDKFDAKKIETITDTGIRKILMAHLERCEMDSQKAFSADGIARMNAEIKTLNGGKAHQPIYKVRLYEPLGAKFAVGTTGNKAKKFVEADKGTNLFFAIYVDNNGLRSYESVPLNVVIERQKQGLLPSPERDEKGNGLLYTLSPNDLVYLPTPEQLGRPIALGDIDRQRIYKMLSCTGTSCLFLPHSVSNVIVGGVEFQALNKVERALTGEMIKASCIPLKVDRLGNIVNVL